MTHNAGWRAERLDPASAPDASTGERIDRSRTQAVARVGALRDRATDDEGRPTPVAVTAGGAAAVVVAMVALLLIWRRRR